MDQIPAFTRSLLHHPSAVVLAIDQTATIRWISQSVRTFLGYSPDWLIGRVALDLVHPDEVEDLAIGLTIIADRELALADRSTRIVDADGGEVEVRLQPIGMVPGDDGQLLVIWLRRVDLERQLLDTFRLLAEGTGWDEVVGAVLGAARESDDVRLSFHRWTGPERDRTVVAAGEEHWGGDLARRWAEVCGDPDSARLRRLEQPEWCTVDELAERSAPLAGWAKESGRELAHLSPVLVGGDDSFGLLVSWYRGEVSDAQRHLFSRHDGLRAAALRTAAQRDRGVAVLEAAARTDPLTGLVNRTGITESLNDHTQGAVLFIDLDRFKPINDRLGHRVGDLVLDEVGRRLLATCRSSDIVGRLGGDEFVVVAPGVGPAAAEDLRCRVIAALNRPARLDGHYLEIRATVGLADLAECGGEAATALDRADADMLARKPVRAGRPSAQPAGVVVG